MDSADERALRDALEVAQARAVELEHALDAVIGDGESNREHFEEYVETLHQALKRESDARAEAVEVVERLHEALDEAQNPEPPLMSPGEHRQVVKLRAEVVALKHTRDRLQREHQQALETIEALRHELAKLKKKR